MSPRLLAAIRLLLLPAFAWAGFATYGFSLEFFATAIPTPQDRPLIFGALLVQGFSAAALVAILFCYPLAFIYRKFATTMVLIMVLRLPELIDFNRHPIALTISVYEVLTFVVLLVVGTWLAYSHLMRSNIAVKRVAPQAVRPLP